jgi:cellulose synthase/poly-beta-1,6-N-acetylglucosamine synthase-like glycosyltransferase
MVDVIKGVSFAVGILFTLGYFYQIVYMVVGLLKEPKLYEETKKHRYGVLISARNESAVIAQLIESIKHQKYPQELIDVFVVADNCTDNTADVARAAGAIVFERFNKEYVGKGYALNYLLNEIASTYGDVYDGYFVFDADNVLDENYVIEMNKVFCAGYRIITSYRNSKNYGDSWVSAGYGLWFLREAQYINNARMILGTSCAVSGTGFLVAKEVFEENGGWKHHLLTEDIEFTTDCIAHGEKIGYCGSAIIYDEQPVTFKTSWNQRLRWSKGFYQVFWHYGKKLCSRMHKEHGFAAYDMFMTLAPGLFLTLGTFILAFAGIIMSFFHPEIRHEMAMAGLGTIGFSLGTTYVTMFTFGLITTITEWEKIHTATWKKIVYLFTFPVYIYSYIPIGVVALFKKIQWVPIQHNVVKTADEIKSIS